MKKNSKNASEKTGLYFKDFKAFKDFKDFKDLKSFSIFCAEKLKSLIRQNNPKAKITDSQIAKWADEVRLMVQRDNRTPEEIMQVMEWSQNHRFWKIVVLSMGKFREKFDQLWLTRKAEKGNNSWKEKIRRGEG